jgi:ubiquinone biosynthesis protein Coq4
LILALVGIAATVALFLCFSAPEASNFTMKVTADDAHYQQEFLNFIARFKKSYHSKEMYQTKFSAFKSNMEKIAQHQDKSLVLGVTKFSDLTHEEFKDRFTSLISEKELHEEKTHSFISDPRPLPENIDWRNTGAVASVED